MERKLSLKQLLTEANKQLNKLVEKNITHSRRSIHKPFFASHLGVCMS